MATVHLLGCWLLLLFAAGQKMAEAESVTATGEAATAVSQTDSTSIMPSSVSSTLMTMSTGGATQLVGCSGVVVLATAVYALVAAGRLQQQQL
jgi:hypothetical protein